MAKGVSPLIASVLLIAITIAVAAILAGYVTNLTRETLNILPTCLGGSVNYATAEYPKWDSANNKVVAVVEAQSAHVGSFKFEVILNNDTTLNLNDANNLRLAPGSAGTVSTQSLGVAKADVKTVRVTTNCSNVATDRTGLR